MLILNIQKFNEQEIRDFLFGFDWDQTWKKAYLDKQIDRYLITLDYLSRFSKNTNALEVGAMPYGFSCFYGIICLATYKPHVLKDFPILIIRGQGCNQEIHIT